MSMPDSEHWPGDRSAEQPGWRTWVEEHAPRFLMFARQKSRAEADAQDLVQEALIEACRRQPDGEPPPVTLVYATIHRRAIDWARRDRRRASREQTAAPPPDACWFDAALEDRELAQWAQQALEKLPDAQREVLSLKLWGGLTFSEIGAALGISANTAASRYRYGLEELRKLTRGVLI